MAAGVLGALGNMGEIHHEIETVVVCKIPNRICK